MLFMVIEKYSRGPGPVYERFAQRGRMLPPGLRYIDSWVVDDGRLDQCFQLMETDDPELIDVWRAQWADLVEFEVLPVVKSAEAARRSGLVRHHRVLDRRGGLGGRVGGGGWRRAGDGDGRAAAEERRGDDEGTEGGLADSFHVLPPVNTDRNEESFLFKSEHTVRPSRPAETGRGGRCSARATP
jgi:Protein of unknown function (DUF3303)